MPQIKGNAVDFSGAEKRFRLLEMGPIAPIGPNRIDFERRQITRHVRFSVSLMGAFVSVLL
jgi:hypothetical protein